MTKEEIIQEAYGEHWNVLKGYIDENGWCKTVEFSVYTPFNTIPDNYETNGELNRKVRPKSLQGIENNNGWVNIETKFIPQEDVWVCNINGNKIAFLHDALKPFPKTITHYQTIIKPKTPRY